MVSATDSCCRPQRFPQILGVLTQSLPRSGAEKADTGRARHCVASSCPVGLLALSQRRAFLLLSLVMSENLILLRKFHRDGKGNAGVY